MTTAELLTDLIARGVEFRARGDRLAFRPMDRLTHADVENIRCHKRALLGLLRAEGFIYENPDADPRPRAVCDRCGSDAHVDTTIHEGQSHRRDCARCHRFLGWPRWYGQALSPAD